MLPSNPYLLVILFSMTLNLTMYLIAYILKTDKLTDISYSLTFFLIASIGYIYSDGGAIDLIFLVMITLWSFRLGGYLFYRIMKIGEDKRFDHIRIDPIKFLAFWVMQGLTCAILSFPVVFIYSAGNSVVSTAVIVFLSLSVVGLVLETIADWQKFSFKLKHPKQFMQTGLWRKVRHPNYTGELLFWWCIFFASYAAGAPLWLICSPLWITMIILRFSGLPPLETIWKKKYGDDPEFAAYWKKSWRLIPYVY